MAHAFCFMYAPHEHAQHPCPGVLCVACPGFLTGADIKGSPRRIGATRGTRTRLPTPSPKQNCFNSTTANPPAPSNSPFARDSAMPCVPSSSREKPTVRTALTVATRWGTARYSEISNPNRSTGIGSQEEIYCILTL